MTKTTSKAILNETMEGALTHLRPVGLDDAPFIRKWHNDPELKKLARVGVKNTSLKQEKHDIKTVWKSKDHGYHMILIKSSNKPIGFFRFNFIDRESGNVWLRVMIGDKGSQGKGYARDALRCYLKWMFYKLGVHRVTLECYATNLRATRFYKKIGFKKEGVLREAVLINRKYHDIISFGMLKRDFKN